MVHTAVTNSILQKGYRYPFLGGVYEAVLSWYILIPTTVALIFPHYGKFNVTAKGGTIGEKYLDWHISWPFVALIALNAVGLFIGLEKAFFDPGPVRFEGTVIENGEGWTDIAVDLPDMACERRWNSVTFSRRGMWAMNPEGTVDDRFLTGFLMLGRHALYGYRSMIEFLPGRVLPAVRDAVLSMLPRQPVARKS